MTKETRPHPDHEWLLLMSDGELAPEAKAAMQKHLEACWQCRHELQEIEGAISDAMRYRKDVLARHMPQPPEPWRDLSAGFAQIDRELAPPSLFNRLGSMLRMPRYAVPLAAAALGAMVLVSRSSFVERQPVPAPAPAVALATTQEASVRQGPAHSLSPTVSNTPPAFSVEPAPVANSAELTASAVRVFALLHERKADLGEPIEVSRTAGHVVIRGYGLDESRVRELEASLRLVPFVELRLKETSAAPAGSIERHGAVSPGSSPFEKELGGQSAVDNWAGDALDQAEMLVERAHALRRLDEQFGGEALSDDDARIVGQLRRDHLRAVAADSVRLQNLLAPALRPLGASTAKPTGETSVFAAARRLETSLAELTGAKPLSSSRDALPGRVSGDLADLIAISNRP